MASLNKVTLIGRLGNDPEIRTTQNGKNVASFSLATGEKVNGETKIEWHKINAWERLADLAKNYLAKGKLVYVEGKIQSREFNVDGVKRKVTEIVATNIQLCDSKQSTNSSENNTSNSSQGKEDVNSYKFDDDDIPF